MLNGKTKSLGTAVGLPFYCCGILKIVITVMISAYLKSSLTSVGNLSEREFQIQIITTTAAILVEFRLLFPSNIQYPP